MPKSITLATLPQATAQEVFDKIANHLLTQMEKSILSRDDYEYDDTCAYRGEGGRSCAAGVLMSDEEYDSDIEDHRWDVLIREGKVPSAHRDLIIHMQRIHDQYNEDQWRDRLWELCWNKNIVPTELMGVPNRVPWCFDISELDKQEFIDLVLEIETYDVNVLSSNTVDTWANHYESLCRTNIATLLGVNTDNYLALGDTVSHFKLSDSKAKVMQFQILDDVKMHLKRRYVKRT